VNDDAGQMQEGGATWRNEEQNVEDGQKNDSGKARTNPTI